MAGKMLQNSEKVETAWRKYLVEGKTPDDVYVPWYLSKRLRSLYRHLPAEPRCRFCYYPFDGLGGSVMRHFFGIMPSKMNPQICNMCEQFAREFGGGAEVEVSILFADVRGSTGLAEKMKPTEFSQLINRFYGATTKVLFDSGAMVEKLIGDAVTGFYTPGFSGPNHARVAVEAARSILSATGHGRPAGPWIPVGIGVHTGIAFVGAVQADSGASDIVVLGDTANTGARIASLAGPGEILASQATAEAAGLVSAEGISGEAAGNATGIEMRRLDLRGRGEPVDVWVL